MTAPTELETMVLLRIHREEDPWGPRGYTGGSRRVSQALGRLKRKGLIRDLRIRYVVTDAGREVAEARR